MRKLFLYVFIIGVILIVPAGWYLFFKPNVNTEKIIAVKIPTGSNFNDVLKIFKENNALIDERAFVIVSALKKYTLKVKAGNYILTKNMNNRQIVNLLKSGNQTPVTLIVYNIRTKEEFAGLVGRTIETDSAAIISKLNGEKFCVEYELDTAKILAHIITDNYELWWNTSADRFFENMNDAYNAFWNEERKSKAAALYLTPTEVIILASIVEKEVIFDKEMPTVAGVYLNRIKIGMPLQADPTLVFALRDFDAKRITNFHKEFDSPYNTYMYAGLPPGPICMPRKKSIDAVLNAEEHTYLYFCANPDMSGYSVFSRTYEEQMNVAAEYRRKLDKMNIR